MHTLHLGECAFIFDGDFSGEVEIVKNNERMKVTIDALVLFVAEYARQEKISRIENSNALDLIMGKV